MLQSAVCIVKTAGVANIYSVVSSLAPKYNKTSRRTSHQQFECLLFVCCAVCPVAIISSFTVNLLSLSAVEFFVFFCLLLSLLIHSSLGCSGIYSRQFYLQFTVLFLIFEIIFTRFLSFPFFLSWFPFLFFFFLNSLYSCSSLFLILFYEASSCLFGFFVFFLKC